MVILLVYSCFTFFDVLRIADNSEHDIRLLSDLPKLNLILTPILLLFAILLIFIKRPKNLLW
jgi:hypothetical protein